ncbi:MAG: hypothetical protein R3F54_24470 [Alphaproteobacteria bacterium]
MYYFWLTVFLALVVFIGRLPATLRRVRAQREALRPIEPITRFDHLPCMLNTIGAVITEFFMLGLMTLAVFILSNAAFGTLWQAPDLSTGLRHVSLGATVLIMTIAAFVLLLLTSPQTIRTLLLFSVVFAAVALMVMVTAGEQGPVIVLFARAAAGAPALLIAILGRFF